MTINKREQIIKILIKNETIDMNEDRDNPIVTYIEKKDYETVADSILALFEQPENQAEKLYQFVYNPMIHESVSYTVSIHRTRIGAEISMEFHKAETLKEYEKTQKERKESGDDFEYSPFGTFEYWGITEIEIKN